MVEGVLFWEFDCVMLVLLGWYFMVFMVLKTYGSLYLCVYSYATFEDGDTF